LLQLSGLEAILSSVLDRREDRTRRPATHGRASINLALFPRQSRINNDSWNREPDGIWSENGICMSLRWFHHSSVLAIIGFETSTSFRPIPISADRRFQVDESTPTAGLRVPSRGEPDLREQLGDRRLRLNDHQRRRLAAKAKVLGRKVLDQIATIATPETLLAWHRKLIAQKYEGTAHRTSGRPRTGGEIESLVVRMAEENRDWGYRRIQGALSNLGHQLARSTIAQILERHGIEPAPERIRKTTWPEFVSQHWELIMATDFFTVQVWTRRGLQRLWFCFSWRSPRGRSRLPGSRVPRMSTSRPRESGQASYGFTCGEPGSWQGAHRFSVFRTLRDKAFSRVLIGLMKDDAELFKQFSDKPEFKRWLADTIFSVTYQPTP
jgi:hypothetical protein